MAFKDHRGYAVSRLTRVRASLIGVGVLAMAYAVVAALTGGSFRPVSQITYFIVALVANDGLVTPIAIVAGLALTRWLPAHVRGLVQAALYASAIVTIIAFPFALGRGWRPDNPSALPLNYTHGWLWLLGVIWLVAGVAVLWRLRPAARSVRRR